MALAGMMLGVLIMSVPLAIVSPPAYQFGPATTEGRATAIEEFAAGMENKTITTTTVRQQTEKPIPFDVEAASTVVTPQPPGYLRTAGIESTFSSPQQLSLILALIIPALLVSLLVYAIQLRRVKRLD